MYTFIYSFCILLQIYIKKCVLWWSCSGTSLDYLQCLSNRYLGLVSKKSHKNRAFGRQFTQAVYVIALVRAHWRASICKSVTLGKGDWKC